MPRHLLGSFDLTTPETHALVERASALRAGRALDLARRVAALFFFQPSLRTRLSCEAAMARYGGSAVAMTPGSDTWKFAWKDGVCMDGEEQEHVRELAPVVSRMAQIASASSASRTALRTRSDPPGGPCGDNGLDAATGSGAGDMGPFWPTRDG